MSHLFRHWRHSLWQSSTYKFGTCFAALSFPLACIGFIGMAVTASAQKPVSGKAAHGEAIFKTQCIGCHNKQAGDTTPFGPPNLHGIIGTTPPQITPQVVMQTVKQGKGIMPSFDGKLSPADISDIVAYLKTQ